MDLPILIDNRGVGLMVKDPMEYHYSPIANIIMSIIVIRKIGD